MPYPCLTTSVYQRSAVSPTDHPPGGATTWRWRPWARSSSPSPSAGLGPPDLQLAGEAATSPARLDLVREVTCDVAVLDLNMPGGSGLDAIQVPEASTRLDRCWS